MIGRGLASMAAFLAVVAFGFLVGPFLILGHAWDLATKVAQHGLEEGFRRW